MTPNIHDRNASGSLALNVAQAVSADFTCALLVFDQDQQLIHYSPSAAGLLDLPPTSLADRHTSQLPARIRNLLERTTRHGQTTCETEFIERHGAPNQNLRLTALPLQDASAKGAVAILIQDVSLARRLEDDVRQLDRLAGVGTLAAEMAHEIKNALVAVKTFVDLLLEKNPEAELAGTVQREMKRIDSIVAQVLGYSRNPATEQIAISTHRLLERTLKLVTPHLDGRNITVVSRLTAAPDVIAGDENHLEQAILNLLLNAAEAMNRDGTLTVESDLIRNGGKAPHPAAPEKLVRIVIRDTGVGISSEHMVRLFEPFFTTKKNGTGLGLAITRRIIHEHHGLISAESEPGKGSAFTLLLPAVETD